MTTLWDLVEPVVRRVVPQMCSGRCRARPPSSNGANGVARQRNLVAGSLTQAVAREPVVRQTMQDRYDRVVNEMLECYSVKVRRWRTSMSGVAWQLKYRDGTRKCLMESPRPRGPMSAAIFLHEIGHHAIGFDRHSPRCLEEYHAWMWSLEAMRRYELNITEAVMHRVRESLWYAVRKAQRRGIRSLPSELEPYMTRPPKRRRGAVRVLETRRAG